MCSKSFVVLLILWMICLPSETFAQHEDCEAGPYASGFSFSVTKLINVNGYKIGRNVEVTATGQNASEDVDCHWTGSEFEYQYDTPMLYHWAINDLYDYDDEPDDFFVNPITFTTKDGIGEGSIIMENKDSGSCVQDKTDYEQTASINVEIVDPDGITYDIVRPAPTYDGGTGRAASYTLDASLDNMKLTYSGVLLPWTGTILEDLAGGSIYTPLRSENPPLSTNDPVNWVRAAGWEPQQLITPKPVWAVEDGIFQTPDKKDATYSGNCPPGRAYLFVALQRFVNVNAGNVAFTPIYFSRKWIMTYSSSETGRLAIPGTSPKEYVELKYTHKEEPENL